MELDYYRQYEPVFGTWRIDRELGEGSYGKVFEITREDFGVTYRAALKAITIPHSKSEWKSVLSEGMDEKSATAYFRGVVEALSKEFALMSRLKGNSYIVSYEDHIVIEHKDGKGWDVLIRMELLEPLGDYLRRVPMTEKEIIRLGIDLCRGLELCKQHQIIHRDIKPENIFRSESGMFKLGDFGIARIAEKTSGASTRAGTAAFMAPEIHRGERYTDRVDIYSLGLVLYRLTNGNRLPFLPQAPAPITFIAKEEAQSRRLGGEALPAPAAAGKELAEVILRATAFRPEDRYGSAEEMRKALEALETPETLQTVTDAEGDRYDHTEMLFSGPDQKQTGKQEEASGDDATELLIASPGKPEGDSAEGAGQPVMVYETSRFAKIKAASEKEPAGAKKKESNRPLMIGIGIAGLAAAVLIILLATGVFSSGSQTGATDAAAVAGTDVSASVSDTDVSEASESAVSEASESAVSEASESAVSETAGSAVSEAAGSTASEEETFISDETDMVFITDIEDCTATATVTVRIRKNPETDADILSDLKAGTRVTVVARASRSNGQIWYKVCYDNNDPSRTGFVIADFLTLDP